MTYEVFERTTPHLDLEDCPTDLQAEDRFCRLAPGHDTVYVFAFSLNGNQPLVAIKTYAQDAFNLGLK